jgi:hypothetical protein
LSSCPICLLKSELAPAGRTRSRAKRLILLQRHQSWSRMGPGSCGRHQGRDRIQIWPGRQACHRQEFEGEIYQLSVRPFCARPDLWLLLFRGTSTSNLRKWTLRPRAFKASTEGCSADRRSLPNSFLNPSSRRTSRSAEASATLVW